MQSILAELIIPGCRQVELEGETWLFPCGLRISDDLVRGGALTHGLLAIMHNRHHEQKHTRHDWYITETVTVEGNGFTITFECNCKA